MVSRYNRIFNIGLNRAGTTSLTEALNLLGIRAAHHKHDGTPLYDLMRKSAAAGQPLLQGLDQYQAFSDFAGRYFFERLAQEYPYSKFILTMRELESWLDTRERKVHKNAASPNYHYSFKSVGRPGWTQERELFLARLDRYVARRPGDLLTIDIPAGEGWEQLCPFLGVPVPDQPFPYRNRLAPEREAALRDSLVTPR